MNNKTNKLVIKIAGSILLGCFLLIKLAPAEVYAGACVALGCLIIPTAYVAIRGLIKENGF